MELWQGLTSSTLWSDGGQTDHEKHHHDHDDRMIATLDALLRISHCVVAVLLSFQVVVIGDTYT
jgi:hypothetical protein